MEHSGIRIMIEKERTTSSGKIRLEKAKSKLEEEFLMV